MEDAELEVEAPAINALGSLFKLTQVYLWDDILTEKREASEQIKKVQASGIDSDTIDGYCLAEDMELSRQLHELGLPVSFHTNKKKKGKVKLKRNDMNKKDLLTREATQDDATTTIKVSEQKIISPTSIHDNVNNSLGCMSMLCQSESSYCGIAVDDHEIRLPSTDEEYSTASAAIRTPSAVEEHVAAEQISAIHLNYGHECDSVNSIVLSKDCMKTETVLAHLADEASAGSSIIYDHDYKGGDESIKEHAPLEGLSVTDERMEGEGLCYNVNSTLPQGPLVGVHSHLPDDCVEIYGENNYDYGDWTMYWDSHYSRNYFYYYKTQESTWDPPPGMEHLAFGDVTNESNEITADVAAMDASAGVSRYYNESSLLCGSQTNLYLSEESRKDDRSLAHQCDEPLVEIEPVSNCEKSVNTSNVNEPLDITRNSDDCSSLISSENLPISSTGNALTIEIFEELCCWEDSTGSTDYTTDNLDIKLNTVTKRKKKVRRTRSHRKLSGDNEELPHEGVLEELSFSVNKYWWQRYLLFSKYDGGIKMDEEGWFSVTPELIAKHHASRCGGGVVVDCFTGVGGNAIQLAQTNIHVIAIDIDPKKIEYAQHNASIYGVDHLIEFIRGDCFILAPKLKADTVFLSPPWGGPDYAKVKTFDIKSMLKPHDGHFLFNVAKQVAPRIVMFLPRNVDVNQLAELSLSTDPPWSLEVEENYLNGKLKAITAYFSDPLVCNISSSSL